MELLARHQHKTDLFSHLRLQMGECLLQLGSIDIVDDQDHIHLRFGVIQKEAANKDQLHLSNSFQLTKDLRLRVHIQFRNQRLHLDIKRKLRIHDLKTGITAASFSQLEVYAALFCLEYGHSPYDIEMELRIYQNNEVLVHDPDADHIAYIMDKIVDFDEKIEMLKEEGL